MTKTKLTPAQSQALALVATGQRVFIGWTTIEEMNIIHGPTAHRLINIGLIQRVAGAANPRQVELTIKGHGEMAEARKEEAKTPEPELAPTVSAGDWNYRRGEVIRLRGSDYAIAKARIIRKGRLAGYMEVTLAPLGVGRNPKAYASVIRVRRGNQFKGSAAPLVSYTVKQASAATLKVAEHEENNRQVKEARAESGRKVMGDIDYKAAARDPWAEYGCENVHPGDMVTIRYRDGAPRDEKVVKLNVATGKIAIVARGYKAGYRWIHARSIAAAKGPERALPFEATEERKARIEADGWAQFKFGAEFIERSYVVAKTADDARSKGSDYDIASSKVYRDPATGYYWRDTGCFD